MAQLEAPPAAGRSSAAMAVATAVSRALGFVRTAVWAWALGLNIVGTTYLVANTVPNIVYILLAGGMLNAVFVPQLVRAAQRDKSFERAYTDRLLTLVGVGLTLITVAALAAAPLLIRAYAGINWSSADEALAVAFALWFLPQIFFYGVYTMLGQVLNARGKFSAMAWAPVVNNVVSIAVGVGFVVFGTVDTGNGPDATSSLATLEIAFLGAGTTLGVAAQALVLVAALRKAGFGYRPRFDFRGHGLGRAGRLAGWTLLFVAVNQVAFWVVTKVATTAGKAAEGSAPAAGLPSYTYAYALFLLPHAIVTVSLTTALLPRMSAAAAERRLADLRSDVSSSLRMSAVATIPAAALFLALGPLLTRVMLFGSPGADARYVGLVLMAFAPGLLVFSAQYVLLRTFYALEDTRTPFQVQCVITAVNIATVLAAYAWLPTRWVVVGMAGAYSVSYLVGLAVSFAVLRRYISGVDGRRVAATWSRLALATALPAVAAFFVARALTELLGNGVWQSLVALAVAGPLMVLGFLGCAALLRVDEVKSLRRLARRNPQA